MPAVQKDFALKLQKKLKERGVKFTIDETNILSELFVETLFEEVSQGKTVKLLNFGIISSSLRTINNSKKTENLVGDFQRFVISFKSSKKLKEKLNEEIKKSSS